MTFAEQLDQIIANKRREDRFSGVVLIKRDENELFKAAYGYANRSWKIENHVDTRFRLASISKLFTAVAILQLIEMNKLSLDASVVNCLGLENTTIPKEATVQHMLTMTSGIADWFEESGDWEATWAALCREHPIYLFRRNEDYLPLFVNTSPLFPVGEKHQYNGAGYILLGLIVEKLSGLSALTLPFLRLLGEPLICTHLTQALQLNQHVQVVNPAITLKRFDPLTRKFCT